MKIEQLRSYVFKLTYTLDAELMLHYIYGSEQVLLNVSSGRVELLIYPITLFDEPVQ